MSEDCAAMPPTTTDRESSKSPSGSHSIDDILGIKVAAGSAQLVSSEQQQQQQAMYNGSDSSSDSSSNSDDRESSPSLTARSPPPLQQLPNSQQQPQQLLQMTALQGTAAATQGSHGETLLKAFCLLVL